ncbi:hypothetical protein SAMN04488137_0487 [Fictibacillus solisalsi]|uniref:Uncharacterized protein n=1 Tax=Fictibacillus solisalsi TaxID=459525 RepID=A0A1G9TT68_9BACL|nr:hypothetical protein SAMN04488137_0487 [Fictibacillus solisalsi]
MSKCDKSSFCMSCSRSKFEVKCLSPVYAKERLIGYYCEDHYEEAVLFQKRQHPISDTNRVKLWF